jgi:hypothetical protein
LNLQHPARSRATAISLCVAPRRPRAAWHALREFWACAPADALGEKALALDGKPTK